MLKSQIILKASKQLQCEVERELETKNAVELSISELNMILEKENGEENEEKNPG